MSLANCLIYSADRFISYSNDEYTAFVCIYITLISPFNFPKYVCAQIHNKICAQALHLDLLDQEALAYHTQPSFSAGFLGLKSTSLSPFLRAFMKQMVAAMLHQPYLSPTISVWNWCPSCDVHHCSWTWPCIVEWTICNCQYSIIL